MQTTVVFKKFQFDRSADAMREFGSIGAIPSNDFRLALSGMTPRILPYLRLKCLGRVELLHYLKQAMLDPAVRWVDPLPTAIGRLSNHTAVVVAVFPPSPDLDDVQKLAYDIFANAYGKAEMVEVAKSYNVSRDPDMIQSIVMGTSPGNSRSVPMLCRIGLDEDGHVFLTVSDSWTMHLKSDISITADTINSWSGKEKTFTLEIQPDSSIKLLGPEVYYLCESLIQ